MGVVIVTGGTFGLGQSITVDDYGQVSDRLRRDLRVAQVVCLAV